MINKDKFSEMTKKIFKKGPRSKNPKLIHPSREWIVGVFIGLVIFGTSAGWSAHTYLLYRDVSITYDNPSDNEVIVYRESMVKKAIEIFTGRDKVHGQLKSGVVPIILVEPKEVVEETPSATSTTGTVSTSTSEQPPLETNEDEGTEEDRDISSSTPETSEPVTEEDGAPLTPTESDTSLISQ